MKLNRFELEKVFQIDAAEMVGAREKCMLIHHTKNIDAAGDEVEQVVREVINRKLPEAYYVGQGHIVDSKLSTSAQFDIIIADNAKIPILFKTKNDTEYFPFESVYAVGEVKSTYYGKKYIEDFIDNLSTVKRELSREQTPPSYLGNGIRLGDGLSFGEKRPYRNPLFSFMIFINSNNFRMEDISELYKARQLNELPNIICFLDKGVVINASIHPQENDGNKRSPINIHPEFLEGETDNEWCIVPVGTDENRIGANFGFLYFLLITHLQSCVLMNPNILSYLYQMW